MVMADNNGSCTSFWRSGSFSHSARATKPATRRLATDFIMVLAAAQQLDIDFLPITWQPALDAVGEGGTAEIRQSLIDLQTSLAFKRLLRPRSPTEREQTYLALLSEVLILGHPVIRKHAHIVALMGLCWEITHENEVWPVLVFEKSPYGDLLRFMDSSEGKSMGSEKRIKLIVDVLLAIADMHSCIIHGDIKPQNILIFKETPNNAFTAKMIDFGYSSLGVDNEKIFMPKSSLWCAPEHHFHGFTLCEAMSMDVYSLGRVCLWLLFKDAEEYPTDAKMLQLKASDELRAMADRFVGVLDMEPSQKRNLQAFFNSTLAVDQKERNNDVQMLLRLLDSQLTTWSRKPSANSLYRSDIISVQSTYQASTSFNNPWTQYVAMMRFWEGTGVVTGLQIAKKMRPLYRSDYRLRSRIATALEERFHMYAEEDQHNLLGDSAFQLAFCYSVGFGVSRNDLESAKWLELSGRNSAELEYEIDTAKGLESDIPTGKLHDLFRKGLVTPMNLAQQHSSRRELDIAEVQYRRELSDISYTLSEGHPVALSLMTALSRVLASQRHTEEAADFLMQVIERGKEIYGSHHPEVVIPMVNLSSILQQHGQWSLAQDLLLKAKGSLHRMLGGNHHHTLKCTANLALTYKSQGRLNEAKEILSELIEAEKATLGEEHKSTLVNTGNLASTLCNLDLWDEAAELQERVKDTRVRVLGREHPHTLASISNLAHIQRKMQNWGKAEELAYEVLEIRRRIQGQTHPDTLTSLTLISNLYIDQELWSKAEAVLREVIIAKDCEMGQNHPATLRSKGNLVLTLMHQARWGEAERLGAELAPRAEQVFGFRHPDTLTILGNLAKSYAKQRKLKKAREITTYIKEVKRAIIDETRTGNYTAAQNLADAYREQGRWMKADKLESAICPRAMNTLLAEIIDGDE
ncbi:hypothetical protein FQN49_006514 [Arthroderma sp. PD_2]|nr:hypothetical protein FQN49_006514 [Arthroderma sp. PD_2]